MLRTQNVLLDRQGLAKEGLRRRVVPLVEAVAGQSHYGMQSIGMLGTQKTPLQVQRPLELLPSLRV
jgi:ATP-dependent protease HslVU (ClpYQ) ATPase subunit